MEDQPICYAFLHLTLTMTNFITKKGSDTTGKQNKRVNQYSVVTRLIYIIMKGYYYLFGLSKNVLQFLIVYNITFG